MSTRPSEHQDPSTKKLKLKPEEDSEADPLLLKNSDIWVNNVFPFVGLGSYAFVAAVGRQWNGNYREHCNSIQKPPRVKERHLGHSRAATTTDTFYSAVFSSVECMKCWLKTKEKDSYYQSLNPLYSSGGVSSRDVFVCNQAAKHGNLEVFQWAHKQGFRWNRIACCEAAKNGHLDILRYAHANGCSWDEVVCREAAKNGHLDILKYAHKEGCPWDQFACALAAQQGHLGVLKWLHENGCPWYWTSCSMAAHSGHLEVLKYLHEKGCPWNERVSASAAGKGHLGVLKWLRENGCPWARDTWGSARARGHTEVLEWAEKNGCPSG